MLGRIRSSSLFKIFRFMKGRLFVYLGATLLDGIITSVCFNIVIAFITKDVFNAAVYGNDGLFARSVLLATGAFVTGAVFQPIVKYYSKLCVKKTMTEFKMHVFSHLESLPISTYEKKHTGDLLSRYTNDLKSIENIYSSQISSLVFATVHGIIAITSILYLEWRMAAAIVLLGIGTMLVNRFFGRRIRAVSSVIQEGKGVLTQRLIDLLHSLQVVKMFHGEEKIYKKYCDKNNDVTHATIKRSSIQSCLNAVMLVFSNLKNIGILCLGILLVMKGYTQIGTVVAALYLQGNANYMFDNIGGFIVGIQRALAGADRVFEILDIPAEVDTRDQNTIRLNEMESNGDIIRSNGDIIIEVNDLSFSYGGKEKNDEKGENERLTVLNNINMTIKKGERVALVGRSGSGKSTLIKLLLGFYPVGSGNIIINGKPVSSYSMSELRKMIAYVPQNAYLFDGTIIENIGYGKPNATRDEIVKAAKAANAHDFIMSLSNGYDTLVGERREKISGGQKQRIAIARAILKNAPILLLDEATSALDSELERLVTDALKNLMENRTTIAVAHRLSTIKDYDKIYVIDNGRIVEEGSYEYLANTGVLCS